MDQRKRSILIINPNTTKSMTDALKPLVDSLHLEIQFDYFTAPSGVTSINNEADAAISAKACLPALKAMLNDYNGFLVCCYSSHPLVPQLRDEIRKTGGKDPLVAGIFEASVAFSLQAVDTDEKFGIVSTGSQWEDILRDAVTDYLGVQGSARYAGTETTGLNADELHTTPKEEVETKMKDATKRLLSNGVGAICLGCAGMAGMDKVVREACIEHSGNAAGSQVRIIDGVVSGVLFLEGALRIGPL